jgi:hypothetical protein
MVKIKSTKSTYEALNGHPFIKTTYLPIDRIPESVMFIFLPKCVGYLATATA